MASGGAATPTPRGLNGLVTAVDDNFIYVWSIPLKEKELRFRRSGSSISSIKPGTKVEFHWDSDDVDAVQTGLLRQMEFVTQSQITHYRSNAGDKWSARTDVMFAPADWPVLIDLQNDFPGLYGLAFSVDFGLVGLYSSRLTYDSVTLYELGVTRCPRGEIDPSQIVGSIFCICLPTASGQPTARTRVDVITDAERRQRLLAAVPWRESQPAPPEAAPQQNEADETREEEYLQQSQERMSETAAWVESAAPAVADDFLQTDTNDPFVPSEPDSEDTWHDGIIYRAESRYSCIYVRRLACKAVLYHDGSVETRVGTWLQFRIVDSETPEEDIPLIALEPRPLDARLPAEECGFTVKVYGEIKLRRHRCSSDGSYEGTNAILGSVGVPGTNEIIGPMNRNNSFVLQTAMVYEQVQGHWWVVALSDDVGRYKMLNLHAISEALWPLSDLIQGHAPTAFSNESTAGPSRSVQPSSRGTYAEAASRPIPATTSRQAPPNGPLVQGATSTPQPAAQRAASVAQPMSQRTTPAPQTAAPVRESTESQPIAGVDFRAPENWHPTVSQDMATDLMGIVAARPKNDPNGVIVHTHLGSLDLPCQVAVGTWVLMDVELTDGRLPEGAEPLQIRQIMPPISSRLVKQGRLVVLAGVIRRALNDFGELGCLRNEYLGAVYDPNHVLPANYHMDEFVVEMSFAPNPTGDSLELQVRKHHRLLGVHESVAIPFDRSSVSNENGLPCTAEQAHLQDYARQLAQRHRTAYEAQQEEPQATEEPEPVIVDLSEPAADEAPLSVAAGAVQQNQSTATQQSAAQPYTVQPSQPTAAQASAAQPSQPTAAQPSTVQQSQPAEAQRSRPPMQNAPIPEAIVEDRLRNVRPEDYQLDRNQQNTRYEAIFVAKKPTYAVLYTHTYGLAIFNPEEVFGLEYQPDFDEWCTPGRWWEADFFPVAGYHPQRHAFRYGCSGGTPCNAPVVPTKVEGDFVLHEALVDVPQSVQNDDGRSLEIFAECNLASPDIRQVDDGEQLVVPFSFGKALIEASLLLELGSAGQRMPLWLQYIREEHGCHWRVLGSDSYLKNQISQATQQSVSQSTTSPQQNAARSSTTNGVSGAADDLNFLLDVPPGFESEAPQQHSAAAAATSSADAAAQQLSSTAPLGSDEDGTRTSPPTNQVAAGFDFNAIYDFEAESAQPLASTSAHRDHAAADEFQSLAAAGSEESGIGELGQDWPGFDLPQADEADAQHGGAAAAVDVADAVQSSGDDEDISDNDADNESSGLDDFHVDNPTRWHPAPAFHQERLRHLLYSFYAPEHDAELPESAYEDDDDFRYDYDHDDIEGVEDNWDGHSDAPPPWRSHVPTERPVPPAAVGTGRRAVPEFLYDDGDVPDPAPLPDPWNARPQSGFENDGFENAGNFALRNGFSPSTGGQDSSMQGEHGSQQAREEITAAFGGAALQQRDTNLHAMNSLLDDRPLQPQRTTASVVAAFETRGFGSAAPRSSNDAAGIDSVQPAPPIHLLDEGHMPGAAGSSNGSVVQRSDAAAEANRELMQELVNGRSSNGSLQRSRSEASLSIEGVVFEEEPHNATSELSADIQEMMVEQSLRAPGGGYSRDMRTKRTLEDIRREQGFLRRRAESRASRSQSTVSMGSASLAASSALLHNGFGQPQTKSPYEDEEEVDTGL